VRQRAVDLLYAMCGRGNVQTIVAEMLLYLETADYAIREEMVSCHFVLYCDFYPAPDRGTGVLFSGDFFLCLFLCQQHYEKTAGPICVKFSGKVWSDHGTT